MQTSACWSPALLCWGQAPYPTRLVSVPTSSLAGQSAGFRPQPTEDLCHSGLWLCMELLSWELRHQQLRLHFQAPMPVSLLFCSPRITSQLSLHPAGLCSTDGAIILIPRAHMPAWV